MRAGVLLPLAGLILYGCNYAGKGESRATDHTDVGEGSAAQIIRQMEAMYLSLDSYSDTGVAENKETKTKTEFKTAFRSPGMLYLQYRDGSEAFFLAANGEKNPEYKGATARSAKAWLADIYARGYAEDPSKRFPAEIDSGTIDFAISSLMSGSPSHFEEVPRMLLPVAEGFHFRHMEDAVLQTDRESINGEECFVIQGDSPYPYKLWISTRTYALHKLVHGRDFEDYGQTITYDPVLNPKLDQSEFAFNPPLGAKRSPVVHRSGG